MIKTVIISAITGFTAALVACLIFFSFFHQPAPKVIVAHQQPIEIRATPTKTPTPPVSEIPRREIKESDINSIGIETVYRGFFEADSKCGKTYNEVNGSEDGVYTDGSPCNIKLLFERGASGGDAIKTIEMRRYDKTARSWRVAEKSIWKSKFGDDDFAQLAAFIAGNDVFIDWNDGVMLAASNCKITVNYTGGTRTLMSNVDPDAVKFLPLVERFRQLDRRLGWKKVQ